MIDSTTLTFFLEIRQKIRQHVWEVLPSMCARYEGASDEDDISIYNWRIDWDDRRVYASYKAYGEEDEAIFDLEELLDIS